MTLLTYIVGCENDWVEFRGHCYILLETKFSRAEARVIHTHIDKKTITCNALNSDEI